MYLKALTLKGFKSFASPVTMRFEPGISAVVGPNGSGKSNVVDALTWVMGEGSAKSLRGGNMQDVIFAGTAGKSALGRAEVTLTIDNSDGALPIEYSEVSITRRVFRDGAGEYEINGSRCRLMDVQELLSDSGIGREMHVIVGQGKLSEILESRPEDRRAFIEEAAGVLKHRRRKEKAQRKLTGMQGNLDRLNDLTAELRKQLKPLGRQADVARRAQTIQADLRDASLRLAAEDLVLRREELASADSGRADLEEKVRAAAFRRGELADEVARGEKEVEAATPAATQARDRWYALSALAERTRATVRIASERSRALSEPPPEPRGSDPEELERRAADAAEQERQLTAELETARGTLADAEARLASAEETSAELERQHRAALQAIADSREGLAKLRGRAETVEARVESLEADIARLAEEREAAEGSVATAREEIEALLGELDEHRSTEESLDAQLGQSEIAHKHASRRLAELRDQEQDAERELSALDARILALSQGLEREGGAQWVISHVGEDSVSGTLGDALTVADGWEKAVAVALGSAVDALVVDEHVDVRGVLDELRNADGGRAALLSRVGIDAGPGPGGTRPDLVDGAVDARTTVETPRHLADTVASLLDATVLAPDLDTALRQIARTPECRAVTSDGEVVSRGVVVGGSGPGRTGLELRAAVDQAERDQAALQERLERLREDREEAERADAADTERFEESFAAIAESDAAIEALYERLARAGRRRQTAEADVRRVDKAHELAADKLDAARSEYIDLTDRVRRASEEQPDDEEADADDDRSRAEAQTRVAEARQAEVEARLAVRTAEERLSSVSGSSERLRRAAAVERESRERAARQAAVRRRAAEKAGVVTELSERVLAATEGLIERAAAERDRLAEQRDAAADTLATSRKALSEAEAEHAKLSDSAHRDEVLRTQISVKLDELEAAVTEKHGIEPDVLVEEYGPHQPLPPPPLELAEYEAARERGEDVTRPPDMPYVRAEQEARKKRAEKDLKALGKVNPLALEEFAALEERYAFLSQQLDDVKKARSDLEGVIDDVDSRIETIFTEAYADVEREFSRVFEVLFPGGSGRLVLTEPSDMLTTGIEVEARPPGKKVKRLSLLSGGEKSLTAVAMLVAIFKARPSPFYVLDEVEAALDDTNLRRLISLLEDLRESSQLIVITHQKPTMDTADVLYGVSMQGDGMSKVISHRMR